MPSVSPALSKIQLVVKSACVAHVMAVRRAVASWPVAADVEWVDSGHEAMRRARELPADIVLIDGSEEPAPSAELACDLRRSLAEVEAIVFVEPEAAVDSAARSWPWTSLPMVLDEWIDLRRQLHALLA